MTNQEIRRINKIWEKVKLIQSEQAEVLKAVISKHLKGCPPPSPEKTLKEKQWEEARKITEELIGG